MVYGMILLEHIKWEPTEQRVGIQRFAKKIGLKVDKFLSYTGNADFPDVENNDTVIFYDWSCICNFRKDVSKFIERFIKNHIYVYSVQSKYCIDNHCNFEHLNAAFLLFEDIRFRFLSVQNTKVVQNRVRSGRYRGGRNRKHVWDGLEQNILSMYEAGKTMYAIGKKLRITPSSVRRFLISQNKRTSYADK